MAKRLGIVVHQHREAVLDVANRTLKWCEANDVEAVLTPGDAELLGCSDLACIAETFGSDLDVCLSIGGDGTMLRTVHLVAHHSVPILGVNAGRLGYLAEVDPPDLEQALDAWVDGKLKIQERMMLEALYNDQLLGLALNDVVVERAVSGHTVSLKASISGRLFTTYHADGLIVGTPTGSTAYSLSAGGPIVEPDFEAILVTPVAPHMVFDRSLILAPSTEVELEIDGHRSAAVTLDGRQIQRLEPGEKVLCRTSATRVKFLVTGHKNFHAILKDKFGLVDR